MKTNDATIGCAVNALGQPTSHKTKEDFNGFAGFIPSYARYVWEDVLNDERFWVSPGSTDKHHNWTGGLADHTFEVIQIAIGMAKTMEAGSKTSVFTNGGGSVIALAGLWHDYGKIWSYVQAETLANYTPENAGKWVDGPLKKMTGGHLARSYAEFLASAKLHNLPDGYREQVMHCILAHHGQRAWGSPASPQTKEAWVLHLADQASARCLGGEI